jgi:Tfp pilus assembly protein PilF
MLAIIAENRGEMSVAYIDCSRAMQLDPNDGDAVTEMGKILIEMNDREKERQMFERAIQIDPANYTAHYRLRALYQEAGKTEQAEQQVLLFLKYKHIKDDIEKLFHDMRFPVEDQVAGADEK